MIIFINNTATLELRMRTGVFRKEGRSSVPPDNFLLHVFFPVKRCVIRKNEYI